MILLKNFKKWVCYLLIGVQSFNIQTIYAKTITEKTLVLNNSEKEIYIYDNENLFGNPKARLPEEGAAYMVKDNGNILLIESGKVTGYIKDNNLLKGDDAWEKAKKFDKEAIITTNTSFVYEDEEMEGRISDLLCKGDKISILSENETIIEVMTLNSIDGYITSADAEVKPIFNYAEEMDWESYYETTPEGLGNFQSDEEYNLLQGNEKSSVSGEDIVTYACQFVGNPYVWGGTSLTNGIDCSGFIKEVYANFNISLPRTSTEQRNCGINVCDGWNELEAQPGDLVCYEGHIALYIGNGKIVHAANSKDGIKISDANYREVLCIRRILGSRKAMVLSEEEKEILSRIVEAEAGGEDYKGKLLVANVILNRVVDSKFPNTIKEVVFQKSSSGTYQFSPIADERYYEVEVSKESQEAVKKAIKGIDPTQGALFFMNPDLAQEKNVLWFQKSLHYLFTYGRHAFYC